MFSLNALVTAAIFIPFTLLTLYYLQSIVRQTLHDPEDLNTQRDYLYFAGLLFLQALIVVVFGYLTYIVIATKFEL